MSVITVSGLGKTYKAALRGHGIGGAVKGLFKRQYRQIVALRSLTFSVEEGEILGYIGPNGAGKSTTIKIMSGIMRPDVGECTVAGMVPWENRIDHVRRIGVVFGQRTQLWWDLPTIESFYLLKTMYRIPEHEFSRNLEELSLLLDLEPLLPIPVRQLSLGQRMRCELVASLLHSPKILFLDEPTIGLDAQAKIAVRRFIKEYNRRRKVTVILTTHDMDDIEELSHRILVLKDGELIYSGNVDGLRANTGARRRLVVDTEGTAAVPPVEDAQIVEENGRLVYLYDPRKIGVTDVIATVSEARRVVDLFSEWEPIEEIIARLYQERGA
jgi:ABC-2 type transport system ATP-binding protein